MSSPSSVVSVPGELSSNAASKVIFSLTFAGAMVLECVYILVLAFRGFYNAERHWGIEVDGLSSYLNVAEWLLVYVTLFITPYLMR